MSTSNVGTTVGKFPDAAIANSALSAAAPGAGAVIADSGALPAGVYDLEATMGFSGVLAAGKHLLLEHRNAANNATNQNYAMCPAGGALSVFISRVVVAANERIRIIVGAVAGAAAEQAQGLVRVARIP